MFKNSIISTSLTTSTFQIQQVYNGPRASNLSQQQQQKILVKNNFWTTKPKTFSWKKFFSRKKFGKNKIWEKNFLNFFLCKKIYKKIFGKKMLITNLSISSNYTQRTSCPNFKSFRLLYHSVIMWYQTKKVKKKTTKTKN